jgi:hypothetical protein
VQETLKKPLGQLDPSVRVDSSPDADKFYTPNHLMSICFSLKKPLDQRVDFAGFGISAGICLSFICPNSKGTSL